MLMTTIKVKKLGTSIGTGEHTFGEHRHRGAFHLLLSHRSGPPQPGAHGCFLYVYLPRSSLAVSSCYRFGLVYICLEPLPSQYGVNLLVSASHVMFLDTLCG